MKFKKLIIFMLLFCLVLSACGNRDEGRDYVSVWCLDSEPAKDMLTELAEEYNSSRSAGLPVSVRTFPDEASLAQGFDTMRPDILLCSLNKAQELSAMGLTRDVSAKLQAPVPAYRSYILDRVPQCGKDIFPIGGNIQLICAKEGMLSSGGKDKLSLKSFCELGEKYSAENGLPFFSVDSFASLFYQALLNENKEFHAIKNYDIKNDAYINTYNTIAESVYNASLAVSEHPGTDLLRSNYIPCAVVNSSDLTSFNTDGYELAAPENKGYRLSQLSCFAVTVRDGREIKSSAAFLSWLFSQGRSEALCLNSGLVPLVDNLYYETDDQLQILLIRLSSLDKLLIPENNCDFLLNRDDFELSFRNALPFLE